LIAPSIAVTFRNVDGPDYFFCDRRVQNFCVKISGVIVDNPFASPLFLFGDINFIFVFHPTASNLTMLWQLVAVAFCAYRSRCFPFRFSLGQNAPKYLKPRLFSVGKIAGSAAFTNRQNY